MYILLYMQGEIMFAGKLTVRPFGIACSLYLLQYYIVVLYMNKKMLTIYNEIYKDPIQSNIRWADIEALFRALGANITEGNGSRVRVELNGERAVFHRPHPENTTDKGAVKSVRRFLGNAGVEL